MKLKQVSIFLENKEGHLLTVIKLLGDNDINIRSINIAENKDFGIVRLILNDSRKALEVLGANGITAKITEIIAVEIDDKPGSLANILEIFHEHKINMEYMYGFIQRYSQKALVVFRVDDINNAIKVLSDNNINVINEKNIDIL
ncbi:MAG: amino acid-binding protein [Candidatus Omnitrophica bacterium]|nr:amino acid-binding protein [Candidatus Omnitrophota bacterium]